MKRDEFNAAVMQSPLSKHAEYLNSIVRPAIEIRRRSERPAPRESRFGGWPDLPAGTTWPSHPHGPYRFVAQLNFEELVGANDGSLPDTGLLALFVADDPEGNWDGIFWNEPGFVRAVFSKDLTQLVAIEPPPAMDLGISVGIEFAPTLDIPFATTLRSDWPVDDPSDWQQCQDFLDRLQSEVWTGNEPLRYQMLGYPYHGTLAYDPTPGPEWSCLLNVSSDEKLEWHWHDFDRLSVFVERARLVECDFSDLRSEAG